MRKAIVVIIMVIAAATAASAQQFDWGAPWDMVTAEVGEYVEVDTDTIVVETTLLDAKTDRVYVFDDSGLRMEINYMPRDAVDRLLNALMERYGEADEVDGTTAMWETEETTVVLYLSTDMVALSYSAPDYAPQQLQDDASEL